MTGPPEAPQTHEFSPGRDIGGVIELCSLPEGWTKDQIVFTLDTDHPITGDPTQDTWPDRETAQQYLLAQQRTSEMRPNDTNDPKIAMTSFEVRDDTLVVTGRLTNYFTLWGLPGAAPELHRQGIHELTTLHQTNIPMGISTHNMLVVNGGNKFGEDKQYLVMLAVSPLHGFAPNKLTPTFEHQQNPDRHSHPTDAAIDGYLKELGVRLLTLPDGGIRLLGLAAEKPAAYVAWAYIALTPQLTVQDIKKFWDETILWRQGSSLLFVPVANLEPWKQESVPYELWSGAEGVIRYDPSKALREEQPYRLHHTGPWRMTLLQEHLANQGLIQVA